MLPRGRPRRVGLKRMDAAVDNLRPLGFSPQTIRSKVKSLLKVYGGDEAWPVIEEASYRLLIEALLEDQELQNQDEPEEEGTGAQDSMAAEQLESETQLEDQELQNQDTPKGEGTGAQDGTVAEQFECEPSCTANGQLGSAQQDAALSTPVTVEPVVLPNPENSNPTSEQSQVEDVVKATEDIVALIDACGHSAPPGFEHVVLQGRERRRRKPCFGWIGSKDDNDFVLLKPYPVQGNERPRSRVSQWDVRADNSHVQMFRA